MSNFYTGSGTIAQFGKEATYGTLDDMSALINLTSESLSLNVTKGDEGNLLASKTATNRDLMAIDVDGSVSFILRPEFAGTLIQAALGGDDTVVQDGEFYNHTIKMCDPNDDLPSLSITVDRKAATRAYTGCVISSLSLECAAGDYVKGSFDVDGYDEVAGTVDTDITTYSLPSYRCTSATFTVGGSSFDVSNVTLSLDNALETAPRTYASGLKSGEPKHGTRQLTVNFEIPYAASIETFKSTYLTTETNAALVLMFESSTGYRITTSLPNVAITEVSNNVSGTGVINASIAGEALSVGSAEPITVVIRDKESSAY